MKTSRKLGRFAPYPACIAGVLTAASAAAAALELEEAVEAKVAPRNRGQVLQKPGASCSMRDTYWQGRDSQ